MKVPMAFLRVFFVALSLFFMTAYMVTLPLGAVWQKVLIGLGVGAVFSTLLISLETLFRRYNLKAFNTVTVGVFFGFLMGKALILLFNGVLDISHMKTTLQPESIHLFQISLLLSGTYLGTLLTLHFSNEILFSIPFIKLKAAKERMKDLLVDASALSDSRILDLASTGLVDNALVIPKFLIKQIHLEAESYDEGKKTKAKLCLDTLKKLQDLPEIGLRFEDGSAEQSLEVFTQILRLARQKDANILTADLTQTKIPAVEGIKIINLHSLSNALKPIMEAGETMKIKVQRFGKEPNQGVGYLDDGAMVVINGGGDYIGESIDVNVLSVKHTSSGRMIFCNTMEDIPAKGNQIEV